MDFITNLPTSLSCVILREWIELEDLTRLDSAFCNIVRRTEFLKLLQSKECVVNDTLNADEWDMVRWVAMRAIKVVCVNFGTSHRSRYEADVSIALKGYLQRNEEHVKELSVGDPDDNKCFNHVFHLFKHLTKLNCTLPAHVKTLIDKNPKLTSLIVDFSNHNGDDTIADHPVIPLLRRLEIRSSVVSLHSNLSELHILSVVRVTKCLEDLTLSCWYTISTDTLIAVARHCHQLRGLWFFRGTISDTSLSMITLLCSQLTTLHLKSTSMVTDDGVLCALKNAKRLQKLHLQGCHSITNTTCCNIAQYGSHTLVQLDWRFNGHGTREDAERSVAELRAKRPTLHVTYEIRMGCSDSSDGVELFL